MPKPFVHLHLHTQYSLLDGAIKHNPLFERAKAANMPAVAQSDHGNLFGAIEFYEKARANGVKPIIGCEVYLAGGSRHDRERRERNEERPVAWIINVIRCEDGQTIVSLDCDGHADKSTVSRGTAVEWEPIPGVPVYERRGPDSTALLCTDSEPNTPPPGIVERLAEGFAMIDGYENYRHRIGELRGQHGWSPRP